MSLVLDPQKTIFNGTSYEWFPAEVIDVDFSGLNKEGLYTVICRIHGAFGSQTNYDVIRARALDANIKRIPIQGEIILVTKAPSPYASAAALSQEYYYTNPISIQSSVHHNGLPGLRDMAPIFTPQNKEKRENAQDGIGNKVKNRLDTGKIIDPNFPERYDVYPIQPYSGDILFEGRWGQSIRFGSTVDERRQYPQPPSWKKGLGDTGNPIIIISNGTNPKSSTPFNEFILENIDKDDSSIWMTSAQYVKFEPASKFTPSIEDKSINLFMKNEYGGNAVMIASDRIIFNARKQEIIGFSKEGIGFSSEKGISLDGKQVVEFESEQKISLGINAISPILLGDRTINWLAKLCRNLIFLCESIAKETHPTGTGPSGAPINIGDFIKTKSNIQSLLSDLDTLPSQLAFVNEKPGGPSKVEKQKAQDRNEPTYIEPDEDFQAGDQPPSVIKGDVPQSADIVSLITEFKRLQELEGEIYGELSNPPTDEEAEREKKQQEILDRFRNAENNDDRENPLDLGGG